MTLDEMIKAINRKVDDVVDIEDAIEWLNTGKNRMAIAIQSDFPDIVSTADMSSSFVFPEKYHHIPVLYACSAFKEQDSSIQEAGNFLSQFEQEVKTFIQNYEVPPQYWDYRNVQQFTATTGQTDFTITKEGYNKRFGDLKIYVNDVIIDTFTKNDKTFKYTGSTTLVAGDKVTAKWEEHSDLIDPPYNWWGW